MRTLESFIEKAVIRVNSLYFHFQDAMEFIDYCHFNKLKILGIDSFVVTNEITQPFMEHSVDYSNLSSEVAYNSAKVFLSQKKMYNFLFEITFE